MRKRDKELRTTKNIKILALQEFYREIMNMRKQKRDKIEVVLRDDGKTDVYQLAIQFYPLTKLKTEQYLNNEQEKNV